jgi:hypothetical protein
MTFNAANTEDASRKHDGFLANKSKLPEKPFNEIYNRIYGERSALPGCSVSFLVLHCPRIQVTARCFPAMMKKWMGTVLIARPAHI